MAEILPLWPRNSSPLPNTKITREGNLTHVDGNGQPRAGAELLPLQAAQTDDFPLLGTAIAAWNKITDGTGVFHRHQQPYQLILNNPDILTPRTSIFMVSGDHPLEFIFMWYPRSLDVYDGEDFTHGRLREMARDNIIIAAAETMRDVQVQKQPVAHKLNGICDGMLLSYVRVLFPVCEASGDVSRIITVSEDRFRDRW